MYSLAGENNEIRDGTKERALIQTRSAGWLQALMNYESSWLLSWLKGVPAARQPRSAERHDAGRMLGSGGLPALGTQPSFYEGDENGGGSGHI